MAASDHLSQQLFHGSLAELKPGDVIDRKMAWQPGRVAGLSSEDVNFLHEHGYGAKTHEGEHFAYASPSIDYAKGYTEKYVHGELQKGHLYEVEPIDHKDVVHLTPDDFGSPSGFKVKRKITDTSPRSK